jgi:hypothetical protein
MWSLNAKKHKKRLATKNVKIESQWISAHATTKGQNLDLVNWSSLESW